MTGSINTVCIAGKNEIAVRALLLLLDKGWAGRMVVCPNAGDDGVSRWQPSLRRFAAEYNVPTLGLEEVECIDRLLFLSLEFDRIVVPRRFRDARLVNLHFSKLPSYKGMYTSALPILMGEVEVGVTLHEIDAGIDTGSIIAQDRFLLDEDWVARDLYFEFMARGFEMLRREFDRLVGESTPVAMPQGAMGSTYFAKSALDYGAVRIDLRSTALGVVRQLRAYSFREYQTPVVYKRPVGGWRILEQRSLERPGAIVECDSGRMVVATIDYDLMLLRDRAWEWFGSNLSRDAVIPRGSEYIDVSDRNGWTPLIQAAFRGDSECCEILLLNGADPNKPNTNGTTPLMYALSAAANGQSTDAARVLLTHSADPGRRDRFGRAASSYHPELCRKLGLEL